MLGYITQGKKYLVETIISKLLYESYSFNNEYDWINLKIIEVKLWVKNNLF